MASAIDWTKQIFNNCVILEPLILSKISGKSKWKIQCYCGKIFNASPIELKRGKVPSCGCNRSSLAKLQMQKYNYYNYINNFGIRLIEPVNSQKNGSRDEWFALCPIDNVKFITNPHSIIANNTKSCGCLFRKKCSENITNYHIENRISKGLGIDQRITDILVFIKSMTFDKVKKIIFEIDNYTCCLCLNKGNLLEAHHIQPVHDSLNFQIYENYELLYSIKNLITLCRNCHIVQAHDGHGSKLNLEIKNELQAAISMRPVSKEIMNKYNDIVTNEINPWILSYIKEINNDRFQ